MISEIGLDSPKPLVKILSEKTFYLFPIDLFCEFALNRHQFIENLSDVELIKSQNDACHKILGSIDQEGGPQ